MTLMRLFEMSLPCLGGPPPYRPNRDAFIVAMPAHFLLYCPGRHTRLSYDTTECVSNRFDRLSNIRRALCEMDWE